MALSRQELIRNIKTLAKVPSPEDSASVKMLLEWVILADDILADLQIETARMFPKFLTPTCDCSTCMALRTVFFSRNR